MVRVIPTHKSAHGSSNLDRPRAARKKKPYKVVLEMVTQEKKKFHSIMAYSANAPPGYTFVPLGDRELTEYCKDQCRKQNFVAHIVSARPKPNSKGQNRRDGDRNILRIDTQRIGHHFPDEVVDKACQFLGYEWSHRGGFRKMRTNYETTALARSLHDHGERMFLHGQPATEKQTKDQIRSAILEVFPKIPEADLESIVNHAFEEGTNRVGNAKELTLARRVQLAVGAFIRHQYTNYDKDLKNGVSWVEARQKSQPISYAKLKEWRGEGDDRELEETFREVIVLDDDDDEDSDLSDDTSLTPNEREDSVEIISSRATGRELGPDTYPDISRGYERMPSSNIRGPATTYAPSPNGAHMLTAQAPATDHRGAYETTSRSTAALRSTYEPERVVRTAPPTRYFRDKDGCLYNLQPIEDHEPRSLTTRHDIMPSMATPRDHDGYVSAPSRLSSVDWTQVDRAVPTRRPSGDDVVLPSVERESGVLRSPRRAVEAPKHRNEHLRSDPLLSQLEAQRPSRTFLRPEHVVVDARPRLLPAGDMNYVPAHPVGYTDERPRQVYVAMPASNPARISPMYSRAPPEYTYPPPPPQHRMPEGRVFPQYGHVEGGGSLPRYDFSDDGRYTRSGLRYYDGVARP